MSIASIELILLDLRYFLDESLTFIELYEASEKDFATKFKTNPNEICQIRQYAIEYIRLIYDLKKLFMDTKLIKQSNTEIIFSEQFKNKRIFFFTSVFKRLEQLFTQINGQFSLSNELVKLYYKTIQKLVRNSNEFIGYLESHRWNRDIALQILDKLVEYCNDFLCIFEKFIQSLNASSEFLDKLEYARPDVLNKNEIEDCVTSSSSSNSVSSCLIDSFKFSNYIEKFSSISTFKIFILILVVYVSFSILVRLIYNINMFIVDLIIGVLFKSSTTSHSVSYFDIKIIELSNIFGWKVNTPSNLETPFKIELNSYYLWNQVYTYMTHIYTIIFSLLIYLLFEWIVLKEN
jgi:hypothetical protein